MRRLRQNASGHFFKSYGKVIYCPHFDEIMKERFTEKGTNAPVHPQMNFISSEVDNFGVGEKVNEYSRVVFVEMFVSGHNLVVVVVNVGYIRPPCSTCHASHVIGESARC